MDCELDKYVYDCEECGFCKGERKMNIVNCGNKAVKKILDVITKGE